MEPTLHTKLVLVIGPGGAGKTTLLESIKRVGGDRISIIASEVARTAADNDCSHISVGKDMFLQRMKENYYLSVVKRNGVWSGIPNTWLRAVKMNERIHLLEVDISHGLKNMHHIFPHAFILGVSPPSMGVLRDRLLVGKNHDGASIEKRLIAAEYDLDAIDGLHYANFVHHILRNDKVDQAESDARARKLLLEFHAHFRVYSSLMTLPDL
jgi:guanylate kinase